ncbi:MAG: hypothetical protein A2868_00380 [Candidatus Levybacteria bacterium RIFCSPHIGHO2_01_FULL_40_15b]|nr:MAG: hypothetical protein A2868_00380 [Candidatus Levybacteria bacterium RIFCSPHIGHO2_01_FULL_40_15b]
MDKNKIALSSLALDLKRVALGYFRGSNSMAERFFEEALKRRKEIDSRKVKPYIRNLLSNFEKIKFYRDRERQAEDALMYSTLFQNASIAMQ